MIVATMSNKEIIHEILMDFDSVERKLVHSIKDAQRFTTKTKKYPFIRTYDYVTPKTRNNWIYVIEIKNKKETYYSMINYHHTNKGLRAGYVTTEKSVVLLNGHLFSRYIEREKLNIILPVEAIKEFFRHNSQIYFQTEKELENGASEIIGKTQTGVVLGIESSENIMICNTYLSNDLLKKDQSLIAKCLQAELDYFLTTRK